MIWWAEVKAGPGTPSPKQGPRETVAQQGREGPTRGEPWGTCLGARSLARGVQAVVPGPEHPREML